MGTAEGQTFTTLSPNERFLLLIYFKGSSHPITSQNLKAMNNHEAEAQSLFYTIERPPRLGMLVNHQKHDDGEELRNFTQAEVRGVGSSSLTSLRLI